MREKLILFVLLAGLGASSVYARSLVNNAGIKIPTKEAVLKPELQRNGVRAPKADETTVDDLLACPEGTVLAGSFSSEADYTGSQNSDQGRPGFSTKLYQSFSGCESVITGVRFFGLFSYYDADSDEGWLACFDRGAIDQETKQMTEPIKVEVSFYKNKDGKPGDLVYKEEVDVVGEYTGVANGSEPIYSFAVDLKQEVKMYSGFVSFSAVDMGDSPSCWLSLLTNSNVPGFAVIALNGGETEDDWMSAFNSACYCLLGDANRFVADKALKFNRIISPSASSDEKYAKVQVELLNIGKNPVSDAALELWLDGKKVATENVGVSIANGETYKYTFNARVDFSSEGDHELVIKNATPGDEAVEDQSVSLTVSNKSGLCESKSTSGDYEYLTRVKVGDIDNSSEASEYSDFRDQKTSITVGETLPMTIEAESWGDYIKVYVDWNNNGSFSESADFIGYYTSEGLSLKLPEGVEVTEGDHVMRVILCYSDAQPCGTYDYGETEDYTLTVVRPENTPALTVDKADFDKTIGVDSEGADSFSIGNEGDATMNAEVSIDYSLPYSPNTRPVAQRIKPDFKVAKSNAPATRVAKAPKAGDDVQYVLHYDRDYLTSLGLESGNEVTFATYYPGSTLASIAGMQISSVDAWIQDVPEKVSVVVYGQNTQSAAGDLLYSQEFIPTAASWNHIELDKPVAISNQDLWIGIKFEGLSAGAMQMGVDAGPSNVGFGDLVNVGGETWWSLSDLGNDGNVSIRANVTGTRTPAISWLTVDKSAVEVAAGSHEEVGVNFNTAGLDNTLYEAVIKVSSNDPLSSTIKIPVYLASKKEAGISVNEMLTAKVFVGSDKVVRVVSDKEVSYLFATDIDGSLINLAYGSNLDLSEVQKGVYVVKVVYADGTEESTTVAVR